jgi:8-oxo-dGTP pyrophosphatase MutT (NUDIX family)
MWSRSEEILPKDTRIELEGITRSLATHAPRAESLAKARRAAVAVVLREQSGKFPEPEVLVIERASHASDPWSGQMAFPGGKIDPGDASARHAAERESREELSLSLADDEYAGQLDDVLGINSGVRPGVVLSPFVYVLERDTPMAPNHEVAQVFWVPLNTFYRPEFALSMQHPREPDLHVSGVRVGSGENHVMWGLSYRIIQSMFSLAGVPIRDWRLPGQQQT